MGKSLKPKRANPRTTATRRRPSTLRKAPGGIRSYAKAIEFLNTHTNYEKMLRVGYNHTNFNLSRMLRILAGVGNPHRQLRCLHVAGTKGKGSTCHMLASMLGGIGRRVGLYTSPHLVELRERIQIDGHMISESAFARQIGRLVPVVKRLRGESPTFFELMTAAALRYFADQEVDYAVLETGLGGRLDSTNVVKPLVCGITSISYDHMQQLGNTLEAIAEEKAGIFKPGVPVISAPQPPGVRRVFREMAQRVGCTLRFVGDDLEFSYRFESSRDTGPQARVCMYTPHSRFDHVHVPLLGEHQAVNCGVALGMLDALRERGEDIPEQRAVDGLAGVVVPGRLELIPSNPRVLIDAAHNAASVRMLMRAIGQNVTCESMVVIFGCSAHKDIDGMLQQLQLGADKVIFTGTGTPRSADPYELLARFQEKSQKMAQVGRTLAEAFEIARHCVNRDDLICITGSFYLVGEAKRLVNAGGLV